MRHERQRQPVSLLENGSKIEESYQNLQRLLDRLGSLFYRGDSTLWKKEMDELAEAVVSTLDSKPDLDVTAIDKKYLQIWKKVADVLYKGIRKPGSAEVIEKVSNALVSIFRLVDSKTNRGPADAVIKNLFNTWPWSDLKDRPRKSKKADKNEALLKKYFEQFGLDAETVFKAWYASHEKFHFTGTFFDHRFAHPVDTAMTNMMEMRRLELRHPGGPKKLINDFGVFSFARYPEGLLDDQLEQADNVTNQYGVIIGARNDHSGFCYKPESIYSLQILWEQCKARGINLRVIEVGSQREMRRKFFFLENKYNIPGNQKAAFGIVNAHSNVGLVALGGEGEELSRVKVHDVQSGNFAEDSKRFFSEGAYLVIGGCQTGAKGGLAEAAAKAMPNLHVLASPEAITSLSYRITRTDRESVPKISVTYRTGKPFSTPRDMKHY
jgi:hypothetical protein